MMQLLVLKLHCSAIEVVVNTDAAQDRHRGVVRTELVAGSLAMHESALRPLFPNQEVPLMDSLAPTMVPVKPALPQPAVPLLPMVLSPVQPVALPLKGDDYLVSQRYMHRGSTRLHPTKQCSLFD
jgi:hypothetical protein